MADIDLKTETPDTSLPTTGFLFGADSQAAASPSVYSTQTVATTLLGSTTLTGATVTTSSPVIDAAQTWNDGGTTFTGLRFNAAGTSDANSASASLLMDLQVGGASKLKVFKSGVMSAAWYIATGAFGIANGNGVAASQTFDLNYNLTGLTLGSAQPVAWWSLSTGSGTRDLFLTRRAAANLRLGAGDVAAPVAQTLSVQSVVAGTTNTAGANLTITGSQGTGTGAGGSIIFQVAPAGTTGTAQNALVDALTIDSNRFVNGVRFVASDRCVAQSFRAANDNLYILANDARITIASVGSVEWTSGSAGSASDTILRRDAANTLALRNGTNAQKFNVYKTFTDASNYERFAVDTTSSAILLAYEFAGTGISRNVVLRSTSDIFYDGSNHNFRNTVSGGSVTRWVINTSGNFVAGADNTYDIGASGATRPRDLFLGRNLVQVGAYHEMAEMTAPAAPAANGVRIYAVDNGSGKTQLMALFATGAAQQIAIEP